MNEWKPVRETVAEPDAVLQRVYDEIKSALGLPAVPVVLQTLGAIPGYLEATWKQIHPALGTKSFLNAAAWLRFHSGNGIRRSYFTPDHLAALVGAGLTDDVHRVRETVGYYDHLNPQLLLIVTAFQRAYQGDTVGREGSSEDSAPPSEEYADFPLTMVEEEAEEFAPFYKDIKAVFGLSFVPDEFRALGHWPEYLEYAWNKQRILLRGERFSDLRSQLAREAEKQLYDVPMNLRAAPRDLKAAGLNDRRIKEIDLKVAELQKTLLTLILMISTLKVGLGMGLEEPQF